MIDRSKLSNSFEFVVTAGARARQLLAGSTPRVFVGATTLLIAGMTSDAALQTVTAAMNDFPGVHVIAADRVAGRRPRATAARRGGTP